MSESVLRTNQLRVARLTRELKEQEEKSEQIQTEMDEAQKLVATEQASFLTQLLKPGLIDALAPEHARTSCSDHMLTNGGYTQESQGGEYFVPRCTRCFLLTILKENKWPREYRLDISIAINLPWSRKK
jgi:hypothetical protein